MFKTVLSDEQELSAAAAANANGEAANANGEAANANGEAANANGKAERVKRALGA